MLRRSSQKAPLFANLDPQATYAARIPATFVTGVGRSGTHLVARLFGSHHQVASFHMDDIGDAVGDSFVFYSKWNHLPLDYSGFIQSRAYLIAQAAHQGKKIFLESNPMLAFSITELEEAFKPKHVFIIRNPKEVVESHYVKGWYDKIPALKNEKISGYNYFFDKPNHFFSRIIPVEKSERRDWLNYGRVGKIAWMWRVINEHILAQLDSIEPERFRILYVNNFDYDRYKELSAFLTISLSINQKDFAKILQKRPGKGPQLKINIWDDQAITEFNREIGRVVEKFSFLRESVGWQI